MTAKVQKWGNSLAVRIPKSFAQDIHLRTGTPVNLSLYEGKLLVEPKSTHSYSLNQLLKKISKRNLHGEIETGCPTGNESW